jgi:ribonuclease G
MIVVDFIDMDRSSNRNKVTRAFNEFLRRDRAKAAVTRISELGLVEMTRKRTRDSLLHHLTEPCEHCEGKGYTKSRRTVAYGLLRELRRQGNLIEGDTVMVEVHPDVAQILAGPDHVYLEEIEKRLQKRIVVKARGSFALDDYELRSPGQKAIEKSDAGRDEDREPRRHRRRKRVGPPAEVQAMLDEDERNSLAAGEGAEEEAPCSARAEDRVPGEADAGADEVPDEPPREASPTEPPAAGELPVAEAPPVVADPNREGGASTVEPSSQEESKSGP